MLALLPSIRTSSHLFLAFFSALLLSSSLRTHPSKADVDELRTSLISFAGCVLLTVWTVRLGDMLRGGAPSGELDRSRGAVGFEGEAAVVGWFWSGQFKLVYSLPSPHGPSTVLLLVIEY